MQFTEVHVLYKVKHLNKQNKQEVWSVRHQNVYLISTGIHVMYSSCYDIMLIFKIDGLGFFTRVCH
jgi:hypothetical protein